MSATRITLLWLVVGAVASAAPSQDPRFNALLASPARRGLALTDAELQARGLRAAHAEPRLGLPTVLWASPAPRPALSGDTAVAARDHLRHLAPALRLRPEDVDRAPLRPRHAPRPGPRIAQFSQAVSGVEVFRAQVALVMDPRNALVAATGYLAPGAYVARAEGLGSGAFVLGPEALLVRAFADATGVKVPARNVRAGHEGPGGYRALELSGDAEGWLLAPARARKTWFLLPDRLEPAWYLEVEPSRGTDSVLRSYVYSARTGELLFRNVLTASEAFSYRTWADPVTYWPHPGPQGTSAAPHPATAPSVLSPPPVAQSLVTLECAPFSQGDPWLESGATETRGNNADAYADLVAPDGFQDSTADVRASATSPATFDHGLDVSLAPNANPAQVQGAVTSLFYTGNFLHDWFYDSGFDEASGVAQHDNYGRGGPGALGGDRLKLEAQDYVGKNNANMSTPADGASPRMQMFLWDGSATGEYFPPGGAPPSQFSVGTASFGPQLYDVTGELSYVQDSTASTFGCNAYAAAALAGKIALVDRGSCSFVTKAANAQAAGAIGVIIANTTSGLINMTGADPTLVIPSVSVSQATGTGFKDALGNGETVTLRLLRRTERDGTVDNDIVAHEWGHYLTNRLVGNGNGLDNVQGGGMGEGWADFVALLLKVRNADRLLTGNDRFQGAYPVASWSVSNQDPLAWYYGLRRVPYSTEFSLNPLTYGHTVLGVGAPSGAPLAWWSGLYNPEVHAAGEVWASFLWDCHVALLRSHPFAEALLRMKAYLVASLKATPVSPTFLEARDALWAAAAATDPADFALFVEAFAKRGAGVGATAVDRGSFDYVGLEESFEPARFLRVLARTVTEAGSGCDVDGVVDVGEDGVLSVTVRNDGLAALPASWAELAPGVSAPTWAFPAGTRATLPFLPAGSTATVTWPLSLLAPGTAAATSGLVVTFGEPSLPAAQRTLAVEAPIHVDPAAESRTMEDFEFPVFGWTCGGTLTSACTKLPLGEGHVAHLEDAPVSGDRWLETPWFDVGGAGNLAFGWKARWSFEFSYTGTRYDGAVVELTTDGQTWTDLTALGVAGSALGHVGTLASGSGNPLAGRAALTAVNPSWPAFQPYAVDLGTQFTGSRVKLRFRAAMDEAVSGWGLDVDDFEVAGILNAPFSAFVSETGGATCNERPVARPGGPQSAPEALRDAAGNTRLNVVQLDGTASSDPEGAQLAYAWTQVGGPQVALLGAEGSRPTFSANVAGDQVLTFQLVVFDGALSSAPAQVQVLLLDSVNRAPVAAVTAPSQVDERTASPGVLDGAASSDPDGDVLAFQWRQIAGPPVTLSGADLPVAGFAVPEVAVDTALGFELELRDGLNVTGASVGVTVRNVDRSPVVSAGLDRAVPGRATVTLAAVGSDPDGDTVTYAWTQLEGTPVVLASSDTPTATFSSPLLAAPEVLRFMVTATAQGLTSTDEVSLTVAADRPPVVTVGADRVVAGRAEVTLAAVGGDPDGDAVTYAWTQLAGTSVVLSGASTATATFQSPLVAVPEVLRFQVTATAGALIASDEVSLTVSADRPPVVTTDATRTVASRGTLTLSAQASDPDGDPVSLLWTQRSGPAVQLQGTTSVAPSFVAPSVPSTTVVGFRVTATAGGLSAEADVDVTVAAEGAPVADAGPDATVAGRTAVMLRGNGSFPDGSPVAFAWAQSAGPAVALVDADTATPSFTSPDLKQAGVLRFVLQVSAHGQVAADTVEVTVRADAAPVASAGPDQDVPSGARVTLVGSAVDPDGDAPALAWSLVSGPSVSLTGSAGMVSFDTPVELGGPETVEWRLSLVATANGVTSAPDEVVVRAHQVNRVPVLEGPNEVQADERTAVQLQAAALDPDGDVLDWSWVQVGGPDAASVTGADSPNLSLVVPEVPGDVVLAFAVSAKDPQGAEARATVRLLARNVNRAPRASVRGPETVLRGEAVVLDGTGSNDPDGEPLTWAWRQVSGTALDGGVAVGPAWSFTAPAVEGEETLTLELTVTDPSGATASALHSLQVTVPPPPEPPVKPRTGCGCGAVDPAVGLGAWAWLLLAASARRRRS
jgi:hypothetical protein